MRFEGKEIGFKDKRSISQLNAESTLIVAKEKWFNFLFNSVVE
jgi:hypothetical protein